MLVLEGLLAEILGGSSGERAVVVSSSTATLDKVAAMCEGRGWTTVRICGDVSAARRQEIVNAFNRHNVGQVALTPSCCMSGITPLCNPMYNRDCEDLSR